MARLSTGQAYGATSRATAAQLLGGIPVDGFAGELAQGSITTPSLQPRATPVDTFQRVGAPTLGGAPKFFAPPDLPNPGQDLANLSRALGGFSTTLQSFSETWLANRKEEDKRQEATTGSLVGQASRFGPARSLAELSANLEKAAALGSPGAAQMLQDVREKQNKSVGKAWLERSVEQNAIQNAALSLPDLIANTSVIKGADGKDYDSNTLSSDDPVFLAHLDKELFGGQIMSPQGYAKNQGIIIQAQLQARQIQRKKFNEAQIPKYVGQVSVEAQASAQAYVDLHKKGLTDQAYKAGLASFQAAYDKIKYLPTTQEQQRDLMSKFPEQWATAAVLAVRQAGGVIENMRDLLRPLRVAMTGPIEERLKPDGKPNEALLLINTLGGEAFFDQLASKLDANQIQNNTQQAQMAGIQEQQDYNLRREAAMKDGTLKDPGASKAWYQREKESAAQISDYQARTARMSAIEADQRDNETTYVKPVQDARALHYAQQLALTQNDEAARNRVSAQLQVDLAANRVSNTTAISIQTTLSAQGSKEVRTYDKDINSRIDKMSKEWETYSGSPNSYGDSTVTGFESQALYKARDDARRKSQDTVYQAIKEGKDPVQALNQLWTNSNFGLRRREEVGGTQAPMYENGAQLMKKNTGNWSRSTIAPRDANNLRGQAKVRPLYGAEAFATDVDALLNGAPSQNFRTLLKTLTTGPGGQKPSEVILNQFRLQGIDVPEDVRQRIQTLDGQEISRAPAPRRTTPQQNGALAGVQIAGRALGNLLVPPAAAAEPSTAATTYASPGSDIMSMFYASPAARPRPRAAAPKAAPLLAAIGALKGATSFRGVSQAKYKQAGDYQSNPKENFFFDFNPALVSKARARVKTLTEADINALAFTAMTEAGPTQLGKLEVAANLINRSAANKNMPIVNVAKRPGQYEGVFGYEARQLVNAAEGRRLFGAEYDRIRKLLRQGL